MTIPFPVGAKETLVRITLLFLGIVFCASASAAQTDVHLYGGGVVGGEEYTRGAFGGVGWASSGLVYVGVDGHGLWLDEEGEAVFRRLARQSGADLTLNSYGADTSIGGIFRTSTGRVHVIPVGIIGYTTADLEICIRETFCDDDSKTVMNFGAGLVTAFKGEGGSGLHAGFRYTRNYGAAISVGYVFQMN